MKELLIKGNKRDMNLNNNENLSEYILTMDAEVIENQYLLKYNVLDLRTLNPITITEKVQQDKLEDKIPSTITKIIQQNHPDFNEYESLTYKTLIENGWMKQEYLFQAIALKENITNLKELKIIPSNLTAIAHYLKKIANNTDDIVTELVEMRMNNEVYLKDIVKELDIMNKLSQY